MDLEILQASLTSGVFTLVVGVEKEEIVAHKDILREVSPVMAAMIDIGLRESQQGWAALPEDPPFAVKSLVSFAYQGNYCLPAGIAQKVTKSNADSDTSVSEPEEDNSSSSSPPTIGSNNTSQPTPKRLKTARSSKPAYRKKRKLPFVPPLKAVALRNFSDQYGSAIVDGLPSSVPVSPQTLLAHASVYIFADKYGVDDLRKLSLRKLAQALRRYRPDRSMSGLMQLTKYILDREVQDNSSLWKMLIDFWACVADWADDNCLNELVQECPDISRDLIKAMARGFVGEQSVMDESCYAKRS